MKHFALLTFSFCLFFLFSMTSVQAQTQSVRLASPSAVVATESAIATDSAVATVSARVEEQIQQKSQSDLTETQGAVKSRLAQLLDDNPIGPLNPTNFVQYSIRQAVSSGVPANMLVLMLLFPVIASLIAVSRHIVGLEGFGIYIPAVLAVAFLSTGISTGIILFLSVTISAVVGRAVLDYLKLQYLPRTALLLWFVSLVVFTLMIISPYLIGFTNLVSVGIFPILVLILLSENFITAQLSVSQSRAIELTIETLVLAIGSALFMRMSFVQETVILHPELTIVAVAILDIAIGRYTGLRITEFFRFKPIIDQEE